MENKDSVGKYVIVKNLQFSDFMKDKHGNTLIYDTFEEAAITCGMYEFPDVLILKVEFNHIEEDYD